MGYDESDLLVGTFTRQKRVSVDHLTSEVYPVVAMIMGTRRWVWPDGLPVLAPDLEEHVPLELSGISDRQVSWVDPTSGCARTVSLSYELKYIFFAGGDADRPQRGEVLGNSFCDELSPNQGNGAQVWPQSDFFDQLVDDDDGLVDPEPQNSDSSGLQDDPPSRQSGLPTAIKANPLNTFVLGCSTCAASERPSLDIVGAESQELELFELIKVR
ncbi:hypothetical protein F444_03178 [Phytophthora nicotianae P1976]|uniref:Uncharacterized protein n=1 Tax=Phytophthora nicotianae P1976 TaxID=1317066 RepID=A0A081AV08_PHYNI|nr:hypothetical protein F444_03178 [Phytophthora nicotianae P1976]